jgi:hypothetical protein
MVDYSILPGSLDLYELMVNYIAGDVLLSLFLWAGIMLIAGIMGRLNMETLGVVIGTFLMVAMAGFFGAWLAMFLFFGALWYGFSGALNWFSSLR